jgi:hypothetical protein
MKAEGILGLLVGVRPRGQGRWASRCPAHDDRSPSLSIADSDRGLLLHCFAGCQLSEICVALGISVADLFSDSRRDPKASAEAARRRGIQEKLDRIDGFCADSVREARALLQSARNISIEGWTDARLGLALSDIATAHAILWATGERYDEGI